ncbi:MAG: hypothetical protein JWQ62_258 [Lacunisphaera sp.]|nr:hypothetical protein [Lacunisphaera sp.]
MLPAHTPRLSRSTSGLRAALLCALSICFLSGAQAQLYTEKHGLPTDTGTDDQFGAGVAASGDTVAATASGRRILVYGRSGNTWALQQTFATHDGGLALDGNTIVSGSEIYERIGGTWTLQATSTFMQSPTAYGGITADVRGDVAVMGSSENPQSPFSLSGLDGFGEIWVRDSSGWTLKGSFRGTDREGLGGYVATDGQTVVFGIGSTPTGGQHGAKVWARSGSSWVYQGQLIPADTGTGSVAVDGDTIALSHGWVYIYTRYGNAWSLTQTLTRPNGSGTYRGVEIRGGIMAVFGPNGQVFTFARTAAGWVPAQTFSTSEAGSSLALVNNGKLCVIGNYSAVRDNSSVRGRVDVYSVPPPPAPGSGWRDFDIGAVGVAGSSTGNGGTVEVSGSGSDIWNNADQFHFRSESLTGDGAIIARVNATGNTHPWAKVGLMAREDIAPAARTFMTLVTPADHIGTQVRADTADTTAFQDAGWAAAPIWLMLARAGNLFASYTSADGQNWSPIGSAAIAMPATIHVGLAVSSHDNAALDTATFSGVELVGLPPPPNNPPAAPTNLQASNQTKTTLNLGWTDNSSDETGFEIQRATGDGSGTFTVVTTAAANTSSYTDSALTPDTQYTYRLRAVRSGTFSAASNTFSIRTLADMNSVWTSADIGNVGVAGSTSASGDAVTLNAGGEDIWNQADGFRFYYRAWSGDGSVTAHVSALTNTHPWAKAGVMIRDSLDSAAADAAMVLTADNVCGFITRSSAGAAAEFIGGPWLNAPYWVRVTRSGDVFTGYISPDGVSWTSVGSRTMAMGTTLYIGLAACSHNTAAQTVASFDHVAVPEAPPSQEPPMAPSNLTGALSGATRVQLHWSDNSTDETGFAIDRATGSSDQFQTIGTVAAGTTYYLDDGLSAQTTFTYRVRALRGAATSVPSNTVSVSTGNVAPPPTFTGGDIGSVGVPGSMTNENGVYTLNGSGVDIWGKDDSFYGAANFTTGNFDMRARVASLTNTHPWAKAGIMAREGSMTWAVNVAVVITADNVAGVQVRGGAFADTTFIPGPWVAAPYWVRLKREGSTFMGYISPDGVTWQTIWSGNVFMVSGIGVAMVTTSHDNTRTTRATFDSIVFTQ